MYQAVLFDMFETLITHYAAPLYFGTEMARDAGIPPEIFLPPWRARDDERTLGRLSLEDLLTEILTANGCYSQALLNRLVEKRIANKRECFRHLHPEILPMLESLRRIGLRLGLVSNCYPEEAQVIRESELYPYFDAVMLSCEQQVMKPDPAIYLRCTEALDVAPKSCIYLGDGGSHELEAARSLGMTALQATWYLQEGSTQPARLKPDFPHIDHPCGVVGLF